MFDRKGVAIVSKDKADEDRLMEVALEAGADDVRNTMDGYEVIAEPEAFASVCAALEAAGITPESTSLARLPKDTVEITGDDAKRVLKMMDALDDHDDVQNVSANFNIPDEVMAELETAK
jgi:transcriptional/translational regulatory protein YebC/TACO1